MIKKSYNMILQSWCWPVSSYEKFFKINEVRETELAALKSRLQFPVKTYIKENGFLAIVSYAYNSDDLFIAS